MMAKTVQAQIAAYIPPKQKKELEQLCAATSNRMTISKFVGEALEEQMPRFWKKYAPSFKRPTHEPHGKHAA